MWQAAIAPYSRKARDSGNLPGWGGSAVDVAPVADGNHKDYQEAIVNFAEQAELANAVAPQPRKARTLQRVTN